MTLFLFSLKTLLNKVKQCCPNLCVCVAAKAISYNSHLFLGTKGSSNNRKNQQKKKLDNGIDPSLNAVTYLTQLTQLRKESPAVYTLKADGGPQQRGLMRYQIEVCRNIVLNIVRQFLVSSYYFLLLEKCRKWKEVTGNSFDVH